VFPDEVSIHIMGEGFTWETQDRTTPVCCRRSGQAWDSGTAVFGVIGDRLCPAGMNWAVALKHRYLDLRWCFRSSSAPFA